MTFFPVSVAARPPYWTVRRNFLGGTPVLFPDTSFLFENDKVSLTNFNCLQTNNGAIIERPWQPACRASYPKQTNNFTWRL